MEMNRNGVNLQELIEVRNEKIAELSKSLEDNQN